MTFFRRCGLPAWVPCALLILSAGGCGPSEVDRDNGRVLVEVMTALALKNPRLLEASAVRAQARHDAGQLADPEYQAIEAFIDKGRAGDWPGAETDAYAFRKRHPFVLPGQ